MIRVKFSGRILGALATAAAVAALAFPVPASAQAEETISGTVASFDGQFDMYVKDAQGGKDHVRLHQGTAVYPKGFVPATGDEVFITGFVDNGVLEAEEIDEGTEAGAAGDDGYLDYATPGDAPYAAPAPYGYNYWDWAALGFGLGFGYWGCCGWGPPYYAPRVYYRPPNAPRTPPHPPSRRGFPPAAGRLVLPAQSHARTIARPVVVQDMHAAPVRVAPAAPVRAAPPMPMHVAPPPPIHFAPPPPIHR